MTVDSDCPHCGESIQLAVDPSGGESQEYVEDCPVCCNPNLLHLQFDEEGRASIHAEAS
ncbi:MAG: CPXCG motif-containing cysteine-rich protein [Phycisphaeraceae bacterium]|nr:CPXCG motif-containing cysteine-rich protein [Phycisphaeraceae bacterium]